MTNSNSEIVYGLLCGLGMSVWVLIEYALGFHTSLLEIGQYSGYVSIIFPLVFIFMALQHRQQLLKSSIPYVDGITIGFRIAFFSALLLTVFFYIYNTYVNPDWIELTIEFQRKRLILGGASDDEIGRFMDHHRSINNTLTQFIMGFISSTGIGVFITLIEIPVIKLLFKKQS